MASDLKVEIFAYKWFHRIVLDSEVLFHECDVAEVYKDEYLANPECMQASECDDLYKAIGVRVLLFQKLYVGEIRKQINKFRHSQKDFYYYVLLTCCRNDLFGNLTIFDRVFATSAFVCCLGHYCWKNGYSKIMRYGYICWAMYFDELTEGFYKQGGWTRLKIVAVSYKLPIDFLDNVKREERTDITLIKLRKVINSYRLFKEIGEIDHDKSLSVSWVKFYIQRMNGSSNSDFDQFTDESHSNDLKHCSEVEDILKQLKYLCDPNGLEIIKTLSRKPTTESLETSMDKLNICDKYVKLGTKETILTSELKQNITFVNLASKSAKKLNAVEDNVLACRNPDKAASINSEISSKRKSLVKIGSVPEADYIETEYSRLESQEQDIKNTTIEHLFENMTIANLEREKELKRNTSLIGETPSTRKNADERSDKKPQDDARKEHNKWKSSKEIPIPTEEKHIQKKNSYEIRDDERKEQDKWRIVRNKNKKARLTTQTRFLKNSAKELNSNKTEDNIGKEENELKAKKGDNNTIRNNVRKEDERKVITDPMKSTILIGQIYPTKNNTEKESSNKTQDNARKKQKDEKKNTVLIGQMASTENNAENKDNNRSQDDTRKAQNDWKIVRSSKRIASLSGQKLPAKKNTEKENRNKTQDNTREEQKDEKKNTVLSGQVASTENNAENKNRNKTQDDARKVQNDWKIVRSAKRSSSFIGKITPAKKNAEKENSSNRTQDDVRKVQEESKGQKKATIPREPTNAERKETGKIKCDTRQEHEDERKEKKGKNSNTIPLIGEISSVRKNAEEENEKNEEKMNSIRKEQEDGNVKNLLRMMLVLGDKQGIGYVRKTSKFDKKFNA